MEKLDEREKFWIKRYNSTDPEYGYNLSQGGKGANLRDYAQIQVVENGLIFDSKEEFSRLVSSLTSWSLRHIKERVESVLNTDKTFCDYHLITVHVSETQVSDPNVLEDWIKTLNIRFQGKHILCAETEQEFDTIASAAKYYVEAGLYHGRSKTPIQTLVTSINRVLNGKSENVESLGGLHFIYLPGTTKNPGSEHPFQKNKVYCPELDLTCDSQTEMAEYLVKTKWPDIKVKTAKLRISDVVRGAFPQYKGLTFKKL